MTAQVTRSLSRLEKETKRARKAARKAAERAQRRRRPSTPPLGKKEEEVLGRPMEPMDDLSLRPAGWGGCHPEIILDKGIVIDVYVRVSLVGIEVLTIDARVVIASVDTYLRFAEATNRLDLYESTEATRT